MEDFESILNKYDSIQAKRKSHTHIDVHKAQQNWLDKYDVVDKDAIDEDVKDQRLNSSSGYLKSLPWEAKLDLHGFTKEEASVQLYNFIERCRTRGFRKVLIVHGKGIHTKGGDAVLPELVRNFIERNKHLGMSGHPDQKDGGSGATWVIIKD